LYCNKLVSLAFGICWKIAAINDTEYAAICFYCILLFIPRLLQEKLQDRQFELLQTRRSQTEGRIGIFKNVFLGTPLRSRITEYKRHAITWCVLTHNLWLLSRMAIADERAQLKAAA